MVEIIPDSFRRFVNTPEPDNPTDNPVNAMQSTAHHLGKMIKGLPALGIFPGFKFMGLADGGPVPGSANRASHPHAPAAAASDDSGPLPGFSDNGRIAPRVTDATSKAAARHALRTGARPAIAMPATRHRHETSPGVPCPSCAAGVTIPVW